MKTILFIFVSQKSLREFQNTLRDIMYYGYDLKIDHCLEGEVDFNTVSNNEKYLLVFTETKPQTINNKIRRLEGLSAKDLIDEINEECLVFK